MLKQFGTQLSVDPESTAGKTALMKFFGTRVDANLFKNLYGEVHCKVINADLVFNEANKGRLAVWYFKQVIVNLCFKTLGLVRSEIERNKTVSQTYSSFL